MKSLCVSHCSSRYQYFEVVKTNEATRRVSKRIHTIDKRSTSASPYFRVLTVFLLHPPPVFSLSSTGYACVRVFYASVLRHKHTPCSTQCELCDDVARSASKTSPTPMAFRRACVTYTGVRNVLCNLSLDASIGIT